jgi:hypothetical protein
MLAQQRSVVDSHDVQNYSSMLRLASRARDGGLSEQQPLKMRGKTVVPVPTSR